MMMKLKEPKKWEGPEYKHKHMNEDTKDNFEIELREVVNLLDDSDRKYRVEWLTGSNRLYRCSNHTDYDEAVATYKFIKSIRGENIIYKKINAEDID